MTALNEDFIVLYSIIPFKKEVALSKSIIYIAENVFTGEVYVGSTTKSLVERRNDHLQKSSSGSDGYFHQAISTFGVDAFTWTEVCSASSQNELAEKEVEYILMYNSFRNGYNSDRGGGFKKAIYQYNTVNGKLANSYKDLTSAANAVNATSTGISNACLNYNKTCKGYYWSYSSTEEFTLFSDLRKKTVKQISLDGEFSACFESVSEASRMTGISKTCISR